MDWIINLYSLILQGFQSIADFISSGIYEILKLYGDFLYSFLEMAMFDIGKIIVEIVQWNFNLIFGTLNFTGPIESAWSSLAPETRSALVFFRIPDALMVYFSALVIKLAKKFIPFL